MKKQNKNLKTLNEVLDGYNNLLLDEIKLAAELARKYPSTSTEEIVRYGQDRAKRMLLMKDGVITKILNNL